MLWRLFLAIDAARLDGLYTNVFQIGNDAVNTDILQNMHPSTAALLRQSARVNVSPKLASSDQLLSSITKHNPSVLINGLI